MPVPRLTPTSRGVTGQFYSAKSGEAGHVPFRSKLQGDLLTCLEVDPAVLRFEVQPVRIAYRDARGAKRSYVPDVLVTFAPVAGAAPPPLLVDVRYAAALRADRATAGLRGRAAREYAQSHGLRYRVLTEREIRTPYLENARRLAPLLRTRPGAPAAEAEARAIVTWLGVHGRSTLQAVLDHVAVDRSSVAAVLDALWPLLARHEVRAELGALLTPRSALWMPAATDDVWATCRPPGDLLPPALPGGRGGSQPGAAGRAHRAARVPVMPKRAWTHAGHREPERAPVAADVRPAANLGDVVPVSGAAAPAPGPGRFDTRPGSHVLYAGRESVVTAAADVAHVIVQEIGTRGREVVRVADLRPVPRPEKEPARRRAEPNNVAAKDLAIAESRLEIIKSLLVAATRTVAAVDRAAQAAGVSRATVYRWIDAYLSAGRNLAALAPDFAARGSRESRLGDARDRIVSEAVAAHWKRKRPRPPVEAVWEVIKAKCEGAGERPPARSTVHARVLAYLATHAREVLEADEGKQAVRARDEVDRATGTIPGATYPLALVQIDHTPVDVIIVDEESRVAIGRPHLTLAIDVYSRMVVGFYLGLDPPSAATVGLCLLHAILDKRRWLADRDVQGKWECCGVMDIVHADNARYFRADALKQVCATYGVDLHWRPVRKPRYGAHIERLIGTTMREIHRLPGTTFASLRERGTYDAAGEAVFTLRELERYLATWIALEYHQRLHTGIGTTPAARYAEGIVGTPDRVGRGHPPMPTNERRLHIDLLPGFEATVRPGGQIVHELVWYCAPVLAPLAHAKEPGNPRRSVRFEFKEDPRDGTVYRWDADLGEYITVPYRDVSHPRISAWERRAAVRHAKARGAKVVDERALFEAHAELRRQREAASARTAGARGASARRDAERRRHHAQGVRDRDAAPGAPAPRSAGPPAGAAGTATPKPAPPVAAAASLNTSGADRLPRRKPSPKRPAPTVSESNPAVPNTPSPGSRPAPNPSAPSDESPDVGRRRVEPFAERRDASW